MDILNKGFDLAMKAMLGSAPLLPVTPKGRPVLCHKGNFKTNYPFVGVLGFWSWGPFKKAYDKLPYFGFFTGDNWIKSFNMSGFEVASADVSPLGSAWDRACELYAQLTGSVVDYGRAHSEKYGHPRYGEDYSGRALVGKWDSVNKINLICHSFGGPTAALFTSILEYGSDEEKAVTTDGTLSPFFEGGKGSYIYSETTLAGAFNGTSLVCGAQAINDTVLYLRKFFPLYKFDPFCKALELVAAAFEKITDGETPDPDTGLFDMVPQNSVELNKMIKTVPSVYYFTAPCSTVRKARDGEFIPDFKVTDPFFALQAEILGKTDYTFPGGMTLGSEWKENDGLVNTFSEFGPMNEEITHLHRAPSEQLAAEDFEPGRYYAFETYRGSHNSLTGGTVRPNPSAKFYFLEIMKFINSL